MPGVHGLHLCQRLHEIDPDLPVIVITGHSDMPSAIQSLRAGAEDYVVKPLNVDAVLVGIERAIARRIARRKQQDLLRTLNERLVLSSVREQEHAEAEQHQRTQLNALLEKLTEGVVIVDPSGRVLMINDAARDMLGCVEECPTVDALHSLEIQDLQGQPLSSKQHPIGRALGGEQFAGYEVMRVRPNGERRHVVSTGTQLKDSKGTVALAIVVLRDVTEQWRLEQQRDEYLALISHDLRDPLGALLMFLDTLSSMEKKEEVPRIPIALRGTLIERCVRNCKRMTAMLQELTEATSLESRGVSLQRKACDLRGLVARAVDSLDDARTGRITVEPAADASSYALFADASRLERVITNLLTNALKYSAEDTQVTVRFAHTGSEVMLDVIDRGIGIAPESVKRLFERYYRTTGGKARAEGLCLGLYIAGLIIAAHGGRIGVSSEVGRGSTFTLILPSQAAPA